MKDIFFDVPGIFTMGIWKYIYVYIYMFRLTLNSKLDATKWNLNVSGILLYVCFLFQLGKFSSCYQMNLGNDIHEVLERLTWSPLSL